MSKYSGSLGGAKGLQIPLSSLFLGSVLVLHSLVFVVAAIDGFHN